MATYLRIRVLLIQNMLYNLCVCKESKLLSTLIILFSVARSKNVIFKKAELGLVWAFQNWLISSPPPPISILVREIFNSKIGNSYPSLMRIFLFLFTISKPFLWSILCLPEFLYLVQSLHFQTQHIH